MLDSSNGVPITFLGPAQYQIVVAGRLDEALADRLGGMSMSSAIREDETWVTTLRGRISDQAELNGIINALYDIHVPIISVFAGGKE